ncbi:MAG: hypothetical protein OXG44_09205 [Gammaproteobacteria bacterium]|nr:hypothetical protein [Gammaproteobacteria bacterium]MDE0189899.1 hypothetical protein [Gammaproteobacteria bacterium]MDE0193629.1 hypothetical protein [Gammaproteobacteria bacterium]
MKVLKRVGVLSAAKILGLLSAFMGVVVGGVYVLVGLAIGRFFPWPLWADLIIWPLGYAALGFVFGAIYAALYNLGASWVGGIEIELEEA